MTTIHYDSIIAKNSIYDNAAHAIYNINSVKLESLEIAAAFPNIRTGTNVLSFTYNNSNYSLSIQTNQYSLISELLTEINTKITAALNNSATTLIIAVDSMCTSQLVVTTNVISTIFYFSPTVLATTILGLPCLGKSVNGTLSSVAYYNLCPDNYINLQIQQLSNKMINNVTNAPCTFKIPICNNFNQMIYYESYINQTYVCQPPLASLPIFEIAFFDRWGYNVQINTSYSFSLRYE
jgi:hypothetical protein